MSIAKTLSHVLVPAAALAAAFSFASVEPANATDWVYYSPQSSPQYITPRAAQMFVDKVKEATNGELDIKFRLFGSLSIQAADVTQAVSDNVIQMGDDQIFSGNIPLAGIVKLPGLAGTFEEYDKAEAAVRPIVEAGYGEKGVMVLHGFAIPQYIWGNTKLESLADLEGLKVRTGTPEQAEFVRKLGATSLTMGPAEVPSALERGLVDAIVTGIGGGELWQDQLKTAYLYPVNFNGIYIVVNKAAFDALTPDQQQAVLQASKETDQWLRETSMAEDTADLEAMRAKLTITDPTPEDIAMAAELMPTIWEDWAKQHGSEGEEVLATVNKALGR
jgi:TRAP-type C4-dicarboxylate transport system substrate-binding protein